MNNSYKKYIEKAKKQKDSSVEHDKKNLNELKKSFAKFLQEEAKEPKYSNGGPVNLKVDSNSESPSYYSEGTTNVDDKDVDSGIVDSFKKYFNTPVPTPVPGPTLEDKYKAIRERNTLNAAGKTSAAYFDGTSSVGSANTASSLAPLLKSTYASQRKYSSGTDDVGPQTSDEKAIEAGELARRAAEAIVRAKHEQKRSPDNYLEYNNPDKFNEGTDKVPAPEPTSETQESMRKAFHFNQGTPSSPNDLYNSYMRLFNGAIQVPKLANPLADVHAPAQKKIELNIPRPGHLKVPKRLGTVGGYKAYADGTNNVSEDYDAEQNNPDLTPEEIASREKELAAIKDQGANSVPVDFKPQVVNGKKPKDEGPYPGEEEEAQKVADNSLAGELDGEETTSKDEDVRDLEGMTLSKNEALKDNALKAVDKEYLGKEEDPESREPASEDDSEKDEETPNVGQQLKDVQQAQRANIFFNQLGKASDKMGASMGHFKAQNQDIYDENIKNADLPVKQLEEQIQLQKFDPSSQTSQAFRQYLATIGGKDITELGNISAADGEKLAPMVFKQFEAKQLQEANAAKLEEQIAAHHEDTKYKYDSLSAMKQMALQQKIENDKQRAEDRANADHAKKQDKLEAKDLDRVDKLNKSINAEMANGRSAFGIAAKNKQAVDNAQALLNGEADLNNLDNRQVVETARVLDRVLSGGASTISGSEHLTPESARSWMAKKMEFVTNKRQGAQAGSFLKTIAGTLDREKSQADKQINKTQSEFMGPYKSLEKNDKDSRSYQNYINTLKSNGLNALLPKEEQETSTADMAKTPETPGLNEVKRITKDGRTAIFDAGSKKFLRYE